MGTGITNYSPTYISPTNSAAPVPQQVPAQEQANTANTLNTYQWTQTLDVVSRNRQLLHTSPNRHAQTFAAELQWLQDMVMERTIEPEEHAYLCLRISVGAARCCQPAVAADEALSEDEINAILHDVDVQLDGREGVFALREEREQARADAYRYLSQAAPAVPGLHNAPAMAENSGALRANRDVMEHAMAAITNLTLTVDAAIARYGVTHEADRNALRQHGDAIAFINWMRLPDETLSIVATSGDVSQPTSAAPRNQPRPEVGRPTSRTKPLSLEDLPAHRQALLEANRLREETAGPNAPKSAIPILVEKLQSIQDELTKTKDTEQHLAQCYAVAQVADMLANPKDEADDDAFDTLGLNRDALKGLTLSEAEVLAINDDLGIQRKVGRRLEDAREAPRASPFIWIQAREAIRSEVPLETVLEGFELSHPDDIADMERLAALVQIQSGVSHSLYVGAPPPDYIINQILRNMAD